MINPPCLYGRPRDSVLLNFPHLHPLPHAYVGPEVQSRGGETRGK